MPPEISSPVTGSISAGTRGRGGGGAATAAEVTRALRAASSQRQVQSRDCILALAAHPGERFSVARKTREREREREEKGEEEAASQ